MPRANHRSALNERAALIVGFLLAVGAVLSLCVVWMTLAWETKNIFAVPMYDDMFDHQRMHHAFSGVKQFLAYMVSPHNEHRIFTTRVISFLDERFLSGREYGQVIATNVLQIAAAVVSWIAFLKSGITKNAYLKLALLGPLLLFFINPNFLYTLIYPFQLQHAFMACICIVGALVISDASANTDNLGHRRLLAYLLLLALIATLTLGNAPVVLIAAAGTAIVLRWKPSLVALLLGLAIAHVILILLITPTTGTKSYNVIQILKFALMYWGSPFIRLDAWPASFVTWTASPYLAGLCGAVVLATTVAFAIARFIRPGLGGRLAVFGLVLLIVIVVTGLAAGLARAQFGILEAANKKYASFAGLGWLGVYAVASGVLFDASERRRRFEGATMVIALAIMLSFALSGLNHEMRLWEKARNRNWESALAGFMQINDRNEIRLLDENEIEAAQYMQFAREHNLGIFSYFPFRWGDSAPAFLAARSESSCRGGVETVGSIPNNQSEKIFDVPGTPVTISGWAWMTDDHSPARTVIAVDETNQIVGVATNTRTSAAAEEWLGQKFEQNLGWFGYARTTQWQSLRFYALSKSGESFCALGPVGNVR
ncbi:hypothetical protein BCh11DRAFT_03565 [Burkholderia sp. Ch1-1]|nr:hypothetical protein BCh11DRAFT_03565 [Burkholderia sp. Ch1-1]